MRTNKILIIVLLVLMSCNNKKSKKDYRTTVPVCDKLYVEVYRVFGSGAFGGDLLSDYLTDSANFRVFIGTYDDYSENYAYKCNGMNIVIQKVSHANNSDIRKLEKVSFSLDSLKRQHLYE
jgi:hypothetical protein